MKMFSRLMNIPLGILFPDPQDRQKARHRFLKEDTLEGLITLPAAMTDTLRENFNKVLAKASSWASFHEEPLRSMPWQLKGNPHHPDSHMLPEIKIHFGPMTEDEAKSLMGELAKEVVRENFRLEAPELRLQINFATPRIFLSFRPLSGLEPKQVLDILRKGMPEPSQSEVRFIENNENLLVFGAGVSGKCLKKWMAHCTSNERTRELRACGEPWLNARVHFSRNNSAILPMPPATRAEQLLMEKLPENIAPARKRRI